MPAAKPDCRAAVGLTPGAHLDTATASYNGPVNGRACNPLRAAPRRAWAFAEAMAHKAECPPYLGANIANHDGSSVKMRIDPGMSTKHT